MSFPVIFQIVTRAFLWILVLSIQIFAHLIPAWVPHNHWFFITVILLACTLFGAVSHFDHDELVLDIREICLYEVFIYCLSLILYLLKVDPTTFMLGLTGATSFLIFGRLVWVYSKKGNGRFAAWPVFGVLGWYAKRQNRATASTLFTPSKKQSWAAYAFIASCLVAGFVLPMLGFKLAIAHIGLLSFLAMPFLAKRTLAEMKQQYGEYESALKAKFIAEERADKEREIAAEKERSNQLLAAKNAELERANTSISELLAEREKDKATLEKFNAALRDAAHDLQHPMAVVRLYGNALIEIDEQENQDSVAREVVAKKLTAAMEEMADMIDATIHSAQVVTGIIKPALRVIDMNALLKDFEIQWFEGPNRAGLDRLITYPRRQIKLFAVCDLLILKRILRNLIANAIQHSGADGRVLLVLRQVGDHCLVQVRDSGRGIEEGFSSDKVANFVAFTQRIHKEGSQVKEAGKRIGYRLGMHNVLQLCKATELTMQLCAKPERGSMFAFLLPLATAEQCVETRQLMVEEDRDLDEIIALMDARNDLPMPAGDFFPKDDSRYYHHQSRSNLANGEVSTPEK